MPGQALIKKKYKKRNKGLIIKTLQRYDKIKCFEQKQLEIFVSITIQGEQKTLKIFIIT